MRKSALFGLIALFASLAPAFAGEVYVPFASNKTLNGTTYRTKVWVTNPGAVPRSVAVRFIDQGVDGTPAGSPATVTVSPGGTVLLTNVAPDGRSGIVELNGAPQLFVNARLEALSAAGGVLSSANVPVAAVANAVAARATAYVQGLERTSRGTLADFGVLNLSRSTAQCTIKAFRTNAAQIAQTAIVTLPPLSVRHFDDALSVLGQTFVTDVRMEVSCDQQFYPYAIVYKVGGPETSFVEPSNSLAGDLVPGSGSGGGSGGGTPGSVVFTQPGTFLQARQNASSKSFDMPLADGVSYKRATVEFDMFVGRFPNGLFAGVVALRRSDRTLFYGLIIRGDKKKTVLDMGRTDDVVTGGNGGPWQENTNFHVRFDYDTVAANLTLTVTQGGTVVQTLQSGHINHFDLQKNDKVVRMDFGQDGIADGAYFPPIGWSFSNLQVTFVP